MLLQLVSCFAFHASAFFLSCFIVMQTHLTSTRTERNTTETRWIVIECMHNNHVIELLQHDSNTAEHNRNTITWSLCMQACDVQWNLTEMHAWPQCPWPESRITQLCIIWTWRKQWFIWTASHPASVMYSITIHLVSVCFYQSNICTPG